ncbi:MAG: hypothetical protein ACXAAH_07750, partial [Promethearchaeota archaeon]
MTILDHKIAFYTTSVLCFLLLLFMISTLITFIKKRKKVTLYLALNYFSFILGMVLFAIAHYSVVQTGVAADFYYNASMFANVFIMAGIICLIFFHGEFAKVKRSRKLIEMAFGLFLIIWIALPFNYTTGSTGGFQLKYITYTLMSIYGI